ncbi:MAG TPA: PAS domain S-box protein [Longimicrobium sp.]|nr:PAS domain S-box protein [Longimicrobium sp.]
MAGGSQPAAPSPWPGSGEAADALRAADWSATPLRAPDTWPAELRAAVEMALGSRFPMGVLWGPELSCVYNDGFIPLLDARHPAAMGRPAAEALAEAWPVLGPLARQVLETGKAVWVEDAELALHRHGSVEPAFFTFSCSPIRDAWGTAAGVFMAAMETTAQVVDRRRARTVAAVLSEAAGVHDPAAALRACAAAAVGGDLAWVAVYRDGGDGFDLAAHATSAGGGSDADAGAAADTSANASVDLSADADAGAGAGPQPLATVAAGVLAAALRTGRVLEVRADAVLAPAAGAWAGPVLACRIAGQGEAAAVLVAGTHAGRAVDAGHAAFMQRVADGVGTALHRAHRSERAERERIAVLERMTDGFFALDADWRMQHVNPVAERLARRGRGELDGRVLWDAFPALEGTTFEQRLRGALRDQEPAHFTARLPNGRAWLEMHVYPGPEGLTVFHRDVSDAVRLERGRTELLERERVARAAAQSAERRLRELVEGVDAIVWEAETDPFRFTFVSEHARALLGHPVERWLGDPGFWESIIHPEDREWVVALCRPSSEDGRDHAFEYRLRAADARTVWVRDMVRVSHGPGGGVQLRGVMVDVTARRRSEDEVRRLAAIVEGTDHAVVSKALDGTILTWNAGAERTFGWRESEVVGRPVFDVLPADLHEEERALLARVAAGEAVPPFETERADRDGRRVAVSLTMSPIRDASGAVACVATIARDVTEERRLQAQLRQAQKMEAVGRLAGGIAHDFNNLLTAIQGNAGLLLADLPNGSPWREDVEEIERASQRASDLTRQLLAFSRRQVLQPRVVDLNTVIAETQRMLRRLIEEHVHIRVRLGPEAVRVKADPGQVEQVVLNLAVNARDAMTAGGTLTISTSHARVPSEPRTGWPYYVAAGDYVRLTVDDTGSGIEPEVMQHLFEPFFTTKAAGKGTGLGLSTVYGIVKQSGGYVWAESAPGSGSRFVVLLPRADEEAVAAAAATAPAPGEGCGATVLLVEDEETVRSLTRRVLWRGGYRVLEAADGEQALDLARGHEGPIDLLLTDVVMPGGGGRKLAAAMASLRPSTPVLYMSGYPGDAVAEHGLEPGVNLLPKPFSPVTLLHRVAEAIRGRGGC